MRRLAGPLLLGFAFGAGVFWSWQQWPDPQIDYGRELYFPWRICEGDVLYRDLAHFNGPLSQYLNALLFRLCGAHVLTLSLANLLVLAGVLVLVWRLVRRLADRLTATVAGLAVLGMFAFGQHMLCGNFNWVSPYSHEITHGIALGLLALHLVLRGSLAASGFVLGLVFLTKPEVFLAAAAGVATTLGARLRTGGGGRDLLPVAAGALVAPLLACCLLATAMPWADALTGTCGGLWHLGNAELRSLPFYAQVSGANRIAENLTWMAGWLWRWVVVGTVAALACWLPGGRWLAPAAAAGLLWLAPPAWIYVVRPLPLLLPLVALGWGLVLWRRPTPRAVAGLGLAVFSGVLLLKIALNTSVQHYGFALALPGTVLWVATLCGTLPGLVTRWRGDGRGLAWAGALVFLVTAAGVVHMTQTRFFAHKEHAVGIGPNRIVTDARGPVLAQALSRIRTQFPRDAAVVVLPEGVTLNFYLRQKNPTPFVNFMPPELILFGEARMVAALERSPPDLVVLLHKWTSEYGVPRFGVDFGRSLRAFVDRNYERAHRIGAEPFASEMAYGVEIWRKRP